MDNIKEKIKVLTDELNTLLIRDFVNHLTWDDIQIAKNTHTYSKIEYVTFRIVLPTYGVKLRRVPMSGGRLSDFHTKKNDPFYRSKIVMDIKKIAKIKLNLVD